MSARYPAASKRGSARPKRTSGCESRRYHVCDVSSPASGLLGETASTIRLVAKEQYQSAHGASVAGSSRSYISGGMSCSSALATKSIRSPSSVTWRSTWMLPCASVTTSTSGCCFSNAVATLSKGTMRLPAYMSFTCRLSCPQPQSRTAKERRTASATVARASAAPGPAGRRNDHLTAASSHFTRTTMRAIRAGI